VVKELNTVVSSSIAMEWRINFSDDPPKIFSTMLM
jgi:hypothetical protein